MTARRACAGCYFGSQVLVIPEALLCQLTHVETAHTAGTFFKIAFRAKT